MKSSPWIIVIVLLLVAGVVIAKQARRPQEQPAPVAEAQALPPVAPTEETPAAPQQEEEPQAPPPVPTAEAPATDPPKSAAVGSAQPEPTAQPPTPPAAAPSEPAPEGPLPGSQLDACLKNGRPTLADFGMDTCKPCKAMAPILKAAARDYWGEANIVFVELDKYPELGRKYGIAVMPTQIFFDSSGVQVETHMGYMDRAGIDGRLTTLGAQP